MKLDGIGAIVTGGASGLGAASARELAAAGARVAVLDMNRDAAEAMAQEIGGVAVAADVADPDAAEAAIAEAEAAHGTARLLVNCAGIADAGRIVGRDGPMDLGAFEKVIRVNLLGTFNMMRLAAHRMSLAEPLEDGDRGAVVNTASIAAYEGQIGQSAYAASKGAIVALTLPAAREFARTGIRVNAIAPGIFLTPMVSAMPQELQDALAAGIPYPARLGDPAEFARTVRYIAETQYLNAETIRLDGAVRLQPK
ncbi:3-hydroxyacyl-CoA dehydrogenase [Maritimibacter sp. 55A14]|uniref:SDR family NAD(P)-dependent oxidoreductase n=1 Tax=Maritimibacter sp. 55A14 TaxID=2174844 RepID=UPI000D620C13|nr:SDR family NAD(P)-dependent oxidoreductase [Maritimibacter sp. 55A14]PWE33230.1 3-hydroxyacyl-CoA dehydrogenase [Maritimibacter sp. 55A14]